MLLNVGRPFIGRNSARLKPRATKYFTNPHCNLPVKGAEKVGVNPITAAEYISF